MNAAVHAFEDLNFAVDDDSRAGRSQQRQLAQRAGCACAPSVASVEHELREIDSELAELAPQRERHQLVVDACAALEKLAAVGRRQTVLGRRNVLGACSRAVARRARPRRRVGRVVRPHGGPPGGAARAGPAASATRSTRSSVRCSRCSTRKSSSATNGRSSARSTRSRARRSCPGRTTAKRTSASASPPRSRCWSPCCSA